MMDEWLYPGDLIVVYGWTRKKDDITDTDLSKCLLSGEGIVIKSVTRIVSFDEEEEEVILYQTLMLKGPEKGRKIWCLCGAASMGIFVDWQQDDWQRICEFEEG